MTMKPFLEGDITHQLVGVRDGTYQGPVARISATSDWLYICTDDYEGNAMLNIEALPTLIKALRRLQKHLAAPR